MGNSQSLPEQLYVSVSKNNLADFTSLVGAVGQQRLADPAQRARLLEYKDKSGRTPLLLAASRNHFQILQQLINLGADVHYINPSKDSPGGALHEAAARRHEAVVELLLSVGANPFAANAMGRTALDEAVLAGHVGVVRAIERYALFSGMVAVKVSALAGLSSKYKDRYAVMMPYFPLPPAAGTAATPSASAAAKARRCLWLYKDRSSVSPRCRVWLDNAQAITSGQAGTECTLRLHTSHMEPTGNVYVRYDRGYCLYLRPGDSTGTTPTNMDAYRRVVTLINAAPGTEGWPHLNGSAAAPLPRLPPPPPLPAPAAAPLPPPTPGPLATGLSANSPSPSRYPGLPPASQHSSLQQSASLPRYSMPSPPPPAVLPPQYSSPSAAAAPPPRASPAQPSPVDPLARRAGSEPVMTGPQQPQYASGVQGQQVNARFIEGMNALPGESDAEFAARLASAISADSGRSQECLYPKPGSTPGAGLQQQSSVGTPVASGAGGSSLAGAAAAAGVSSQSDPGGPNGNPPTARSPAYAVSAGGAAGPSRPPALGGVAADVDLNAVNEILHASGSASSACATPQKGDTPSAPPAPAATAGRPAGAQDDSDLCIICLWGPKEVGFLHGNTVHRCVCRACSSQVAVGVPCPLCRQPVERVLGVY